MDKLTQIATKQLHQRKEIKYWAAYDGLREVDRNNSIALLRYKHSGKGYTFKAVR
jgi:hypothetical protein